MRCFLFVYLRLSLGGGEFRVDDLRAVLNDGRDLAFGRKSSKTLLGQRGAHLHSLRSNGSGDDLVGRHFLVELVEGGLIEESQVDELVSYLTLGPLLLLTLTAGHGGFGLSLFRLLDLGWHVGDLSGLYLRFSVSST